MLAITLLAALGPALRAGRLSAVAAIASGRAPASGPRLRRRTGWPHGCACRARSASASPRRSPGPPVPLVTLAAIAFGATAVIFAVGLHSSLNDARNAQELAATVPVLVQQNNPGTGARPGCHRRPNRRGERGDGAQPGTAHQNAEYDAPVKVVGVGQDVRSAVFDGPSAWMGYALIAGHWYDAPGEVDVNTVFLTDSGLAVGNTVSVYPSGTATPAPRRLPCASRGRSSTRRASRASSPRRGPCRASRSRITSRSGTSA